MLRTSQSIKFAAILLFAFNLNKISASPYEAPFVPKAPIIDGIADEPIWGQANWRAIDKLIIGKNLSPKDFQGRYKVIWTQARLYVLAEIIDDVLADTHADPLANYWEDDTLEFFIDEDQSGGNHHFNYNAFAYHVALDNQVVDIGPYQTDDHSLIHVQTYNDHIKSHWERSANKLIWEVEIAIYPDTYKDHYRKNEKPVDPVKLYKGKTLGWMVSYCDADTSGTREHCISDINVPAVKGDKNRGYIDASVFGELKLIK